MARTPSNAELLDQLRTLISVFESSFAKVFPEDAERYGVVFTPQQVVDFLIHSANDAVEERFGKTLGNADVSVLDPFLGTGTFLTGVLQSGIIKPGDLKSAYEERLFGNELLPVSAHLAALNIQVAYRRALVANGFSDDPTPFEGVSLGNTFSTDPGHVGRRDLRANFCPDPIRVVLMNPPYGASRKKKEPAGGGDFDDYSQLDSRIEETYVKASSAISTSSLFNGFYRALRWVSDYAGNKGVIALVGNNSLLDGVASVGVRLALGEEFSDVYLLNLKGDARGYPRIA